jgi:hypothetical protein
VLVQNIDGFEFRLAMNMLDCIVTRQGQYIMWFIWDVAVFMDINLVYRVFHEKLNVLSTMNNFFLGTQ